MQTRSRSGVLATVSYGIEQTVETVETTKVTKRVKTVRRRTKVMPNSPDPKDVKSRGGKQVQRRRKAAEEKKGMVWSTTIENKAGVKSVRLHGAFTNPYRTKFGFNPFPDDITPSYRDCYKIFNLLVEHHKGENVRFEAYATPKEGDGPAHANKGITIDNLVKTIQSQATDNKLAIWAGNKLLKQYTYDFCGVKVKGSVPNYHKIRRGRESTLALVLKPAGLNVNKAKQIKILLNRVWNLNMERATPEERAQAEDDARNPGESFDFTPGMLSMDFLKSMSKQEKFDWLVQSDGIGVKTAACILAFNFELPVFAVDTHVYRMARMLGWCPAAAKNADHVFTYLDVRVPDDIKYALHQAFWHHGQKCHACRARDGKPGPKDDPRPCPLEEFIDRSLKKMLRMRIKKEDDAEAAEKRKNDKKNRRAASDPDEKPIPFDKMDRKMALEQGYEVDTIMFGDAYEAPRENEQESLLKWVKEKVIDEDLDVEDAVAVAANGPTMDLQEAAEDLSSEPDLEMSEAEDGASFDMEEAGDETDATIIASPATVQTSIQSETVDNPIDMSDEDEENPDTVFGNAGPLEVEVEVDM